MHRQRPLASLLLLTLLLLPLRLPGQETGTTFEHDPGPSWIITAGGGYAIPVSPDEFAGEWKRGSILTGGVEYLLTSSVSVGAGITRTHHPHTGRSLHYRENSFSCIGGGDRSFTTTDVRMRYYLLDESAVVRPSVMAGLGVTNIFRDDVSYYLQGFTLSLPGRSSINVAFTLTLGIEVPLFDAVALAMEGGYSITEDGAMVNHAIPLTAGLRMRL